MDDTGRGLSPTSKKLIIRGFSILMAAYIGLGFLINGKYISPVMVALLAAIGMGVVVLVVGYGVVREDGWGVIHSQ